MLTMGSILYKKANAVIKLLAIVWNGAAGHGTPEVIWTPVPLELISCSYILRSTLEEWNALWPGN